MPKLQPRTNLILFISYSTRILPLLFSMKSMNCNNRLNALSSRKVNNSVYLRILKLLITLIFLLATS